MFHEQRDGETAAGRPAPSLTGGCRDACGARDLLTVIKGEPPHPVGPCLFQRGHGGRCRDEAGNWWHGVNPPHGSPLGEDWPSIRIPAPPPPPPSCPTCDLLNGCPVQVAGDLREPPAAPLGDPAFMRAAVTATDEQLRDAVWPRGPVQVADDLRVPPPPDVMLYRAAVKELAEIGKLLDLEGEPGPFTVLAAAREHIPTWHDCAGAIGALAALLGLEPPLPSPDEVCAVVADQCRVYGEACAEIAALREENGALALQLSRHLKRDAGAASTATTFRVPDHQRCNMPAPCGNGNHCSRTRGHPGKHRAHICDDLAAEAFREWY